MNNIYKKSKSFDKCENSESNTVKNNKNKNSNSGLNKKNEINKRNEAAKRFDPCNFCFDAADYAGLSGLCL